MVEFAVDDLLQRLQFAVVDDEADGVEPVGGESGAHPVHPNWNRTMRELCDRYKALLIFDEVVTAIFLAGA